MILINNNNYQLSIINYHYTVYYLRPRIPITPPITNPIKIKNGIFTINMTITFSTFVFKKMYIRVEQRQGKRTTQ